MLLNLSEMANNTSKKLGLDDHSVGMFISKVQEYFVILDNKIETANPVALCQGLFLSL